MSEPTTKKAAMVTCKVCNKTMKKKSLSKHMRIHEEKRFLCDVCGVYKATTKAHLISHKRVVHDEGDHSIHDCIFCKKKLISFSTLERHLLSHTAERPYFCNHCPYEFSRLSTLKQHGLFHDPNRKIYFFCDVCLKGFYDKGDLKKHQRIHANQCHSEKPFQCDVCSKKFNRKGLLVSHTMVHSGEKPFICEICERGFSRLDILQLHVRVHTGEKPFECQTCKNTFASKTVLNRHLRVHTGEKPFECQICWKKFTQKSSLNTHLRKHTEKAVLL